MGLSDAQKVSAAMAWAEESRAHDKRRFIEQAAIAAMQATIINESVFDYTYKCAEKDSENVHVLLAQGAVKAATALWEELDEKVNPVSDIIVRMRNADGSTYVRYIDISGQLLAANTLGEFAAATTSAK